MEGENDLEQDIDMDSALETMSEGLGFGKAEAPIVDDKPVDDAPLDEPIKDEPLDAPVDEPVDTTPASSAPKSWSKETHPIWDKLPPEAKAQIEHREKQILEGLSEYKQAADFGRQIETVVKPYEQMFSQAGVDVQTGLKYLVNAQALLQYGTPEQKTAELKRIATQYGVDLTGQAQEQQLDPNVKALQEQIQSIQSNLTQRQQQEYQRVQEQKRAEVEAFAQDESHPYFEEVADDIVAMIKVGFDLQTAYEKAVWANPVTRQKEIARLNKENVASLREKAKTETTTAGKATSVNVRTRDTAKSPTEPKGKLFGEEHQAEMLAIAGKK